MTETEVAKLKYCCDLLRKTESDIIRLGIEKVYQELQKKRLPSLENYNLLEPPNHNGFDKNYPSVFFV